VRAGVSGPPEGGHYSVCDVSPAKAE
jgi:hypothetical protein